MLIYKKNDYQGHVLHITNLKQKASKTQHSLILGLICFTLENGTHKTTVGWRLG